MIVDTSAMIAILAAEPERDAFLDVLAATEQAKMSAGTYLECGLVLDSRRNPAVSRSFDALLERWGVAIVATDAQQARRAREAYRDFGRGSGHAAQLNFGDCFAYALASVSGEPLLFKGADFGHTDLRAAS